VSHSKNILVIPLQLARDKLQPESENALYMLTFVSMTVVYIIGVVKLRQYHKLTLRIQSDTLLK